MRYWCEHVEKLRNYLKRADLSVTDSALEESTVYCRQCDDYYELSLDPLYFDQEDDEEEEE